MKQIKIIDMPYLSGARRNNLKLYELDDPAGYTCTRWVYVAGLNFQLTEKVRQIWNSCAENDPKHVKLR